MQLNLSTFSFIIQVSVYLRTGLSQAKFQVFFNVTPNLQLKWHYTIYIQTLSAIVAFHHTGTERRQLGFL